MDGFSEDLAVRVYNRLLLNGPTMPKQIADDEDVSPDHVELAIAALLELRLVKESEEQPEYIVAMNPEVAEVELIGPLERSIHLRYRKLSTLRQRLEVMKSAFDEVRRARQHDPAVVVVCSTKEIRLRLDQAAEHCQHEMCTMHPGGARDPEQLRQALPRDLALLERNVPVRAIYQHSARADIPTREYMRQLAQSGAAVRTTTEIFEHLTIFDQREAFAAQPACRDGESGSMVIVRDPAVVSVLHRIFEHTWCSATDFERHQGTYTETLDNVRSAILDLLSAGLKDDVIARRLGISSRTCRRHISALMDQLNAASRFQAGFAVARAGLLPEQANPEASLSRQ